MTDAGKLPPLRKFLLTLMLEREVDPRRRAEVRGISDPAKGTANPGPFSGWAVKGGAKPRPTVLILASVGRGSVN